MKPRCPPATLALGSSLNTLSRHPAQCLLVSTPPPLVRRTPLTSQHTATLLVRSRGHHCVCRDHRSLAHSGHSAPSPRCAAGLPGPRAPPPTACRAACCRTECCWVSAPPRTGPAPGRSPDAAVPHHHRPQSTGGRMGRARVRARPGLATPHPRAPGLTSLQEEVYQLRQGWAPQGRRAGGWAGPGWQWKGRSGRRCRVSTHCTSRTEVPPPQLREHCGQRTCVHTSPRACTCLGGGSGQASDLPIARARP